MTNVILMKQKNSNRHKIKIQSVRIYSKTCPYCHYSGSNWPDSGECPGCGETS